MSKLLWIVCGIALVRGFTRFDSVDPANWMQQSLSVIGGKTLKQLTLPGTHDSGTYNLTDHLMPGDQSDFIEIVTYVAEKLLAPVDEIIQGWSETQDLDFYEQMEQGIRYFDVRSGWYNETEEWRVFHYKVGNQVEIVLNDVKRFIDDHSGEIVVLELSHFEGFPTNSNIVGLQQLVTGIFGDLLLPYDPKFTTTIQQMVSQNKRVIVTFESIATYMPQIWYADAIYNTYANKDNLKEMESYNTDQVSNYLNGKHSDALYKISWTLTENLSTVLKSILPSEPKSLFELAATANPSLPTFWKSIKSQETTAEDIRMGNIVIIDHVEASALLDVILDMNGISPLPETEISYF